MSEASGRGGDPPIVQYWDTPEAPDYVEERIESFRERNPDTRHLLFDERTAGALIAERFGEREAKAFQACAVPTMQSDYFRYCAAHALGGVYVDVGYRCVAPLDTLLEPAAGGKLFRVEPLGFLLSGFFAFRAPAHPLPRLALDVITVNIEHRASEMVQMTTGPWTLSALALLHEIAREQGRGESLSLERLREPFRRRVPAMAVTDAARMETERMVEPLFEAVGDLDRLREAFANVRIDRYREASAWVAEPDGPLPYKASNRYWARWQARRTIFR